MKLLDIKKLIGISVPHILDNVEIANWYFDSRMIIEAEQSIFISLKGEYRQGEDFIQDAYNRGIRIFLSSKNHFLPEDACELVVENTLEVLQKLAKKHRSTFVSNVVGIAGSNGKTIVKDWLAYVLDSEFKIERSPKSYNSQIGVPLSILSFDQQADAYIVEAGISQVNEMWNLAKIVQPNIGILTNIGDAHSDGFDSVEQKLEEKLKLFESCDVIIFCEDKFQNFKNHINQFCQTKNIKTKTWTLNQNRKNSIVVVKTVKYSIIKYKENKEISIPFVDDVSIENAINCIICSEQLNMLTPIVIERFGQLPLVEMRMEFIKGKNQSIIINDTYNADLESCKIALSSLSLQKGFRKKVLLMSDINSHKNHSEHTYKSLVDLIQNVDIDKLYLIGEDWKKYAYLFDTTFQKKISNYDNIQTLIEDVRKEDFYKNIMLVKGSRVFQMEKIVSLLQAKNHTAFMEISLDHLKFNFNAYKKILQPETKIMVMVKAFSYGMGVYEVAFALQNWGANYLGVAYTDEGIRLRREGINLPIMVMNSDEDTLEDCFFWNLEPEIYNLAMLNKAVNLASKIHERPLSIHLKMDTGMHRLGFRMEELPEIVEILNQSKQIKIESVFSHLATADTISKTDYVYFQIDQYERMIQYLQNNLKENQFMKHILNSAGIEKFTNYQFDMVRLGIGLYGVSPFVDNKLNLKPVATLKARISQIHHLKKGEFVGYGNVGEMPYDGKIATINIGYADGYPRVLSNGKGWVFVGGHRAKVMGNICMDITMIDISHIANVEVGDLVTIFGEEPTVLEVSKNANTIGYEILTSISPRIERIYLSN